MNKTSIEWTTFSANPIKYRRKSDGKVVWGCIKTSPGCANCYSEAIAMRFNRGGAFTVANMRDLEPFLDEAECHKMRTAKTIGGVLVSGSQCFIGDMTDIFGDWVSDDLLNRLFSNVLELRADVTWQILTKRAERMGRYLSWRWGKGRIPARNIHVGTSVENQQTADERIPHLLKCPAAIRFLSCEPLLGPIAFRQHFPDGGHRNLLTGQFHGLPAKGTNGHLDFIVDSCDPNFPRIHWCIVGGESGHNARACKLKWIRSIVRQCQSADVACFVKQLGARITIHNDCVMEWPHEGNRLIDCDPDYMPQYQGEEMDVRTEDRKGGDPSEWPVDLRIRQLPLEAPCPK